MPETKHRHRKLEERVTELETLTTELTTALVNTSELTMALAARHSELLASLGLTDDVQGAIEVVRLGAGDAAAERLRVRLEGASQAKSR